MAQLNITSVTFEQLELLLTYCVARKEANDGNKFSSGAQYFLDIDSGVLKIYNGANTEIYNSSSAIPSAFLKGISYNGTSDTHVITDQSDTPYSIPNVTVPGTSASTTYLAFIKIAGTEYKITRDWNDLTGKPNTFTPSAHNHVKADITDFSHTHVKSDITDFSHTHVKTDITDFSHTHTKTDITDFSHTHVKADITDFAHNHVKSDITDFPTNLSSFTNDVIEGNPTVPSGTTPTALTGLKIGASYYSISSGSTITDYLKSISVSGTTSITIVPVVGGVEQSPVTFTPSGGGGGGGLSDVTIDSISVVSGTTAAFETGDGLAFDAVTKKIAIDLVTLGGLEFSSGKLQVKLGTNLTFNSSTGAIDAPNPGMSNPMTTAGDIIYQDANGAQRLAKGTAGQVLTMNSGATAPEWKTPSSGMTNPMTTAGDIIIGGASGTPTRLGLGSAGQALVSDGSTVKWANLGTTLFAGSQSGTITCASVADGHVFAWYGKHNGNGNATLVLFNVSQFGTTVGASFGGWTCGLVVTKNSNTSITFSAEYDWGGDNSVTTYSFIQIC